MASYTTNLNLLKKDPVADASDTFNITTMLNENWDKIDAAMGAARSAEPYSAAKTYAVGDYCTRDGALFKCTVAITTAEAWTAAHWKATTVAAELLAIIAALSNKAEKTTLGIAETTVNLNDLDTIGSILVYGTSVNFPPVLGTNRWGLLTVGQNGSKGVTQDLALSVNTGEISERFYRIFNGLNWSVWVKIATATPPTEYDLPLASGWSAARLKYLKTQDGMVTLDGYDITSGSTGTGAWKIATLPAGHRPGNAVFAVVTNYTTDAMTTVSELIINQDGNVFLHRTDTSATKHAVCVTFRAAD